MTHLCFAQGVDGKAPALQIIDDVPPAGSIVPATPVAVTHTTPLTTGIVQFPITEKVNSDNINPAAPATPPGPAADVAASLISPAMPAVPKPGLPAKPAAMPHPVTVPPVPAKRPAIAEASPAIVASAKAAANRGEAGKQTQDTILTHKAAGPRMLTIQPAKIEAEPLADPLARQLLQPDKQQLVKAIEAVAARQPQQAQLAPAQAPPQTVKTPAETLNPMVPQSQNTGSERQIALTAQPGETTLTPGATAILTQQALPLLHKNPNWSVRIDAYASAVSDEPLNARRTALSRALTIRAWFMDHGVTAHRIDLRAFGPESGHSPADETDMYLLPADRR